MATYDLITLQAMIDKKTDEKIAEGSARIRRAILDGAAAYTRATNISADSIGVRVSGNDTMRFTVAPEGEPIRAGDLVSFNGRGEVVRGAGRPAGVAAADASGDTVDVVIRGIATMPADPGEPARAVHRARILAALDRERTRAPITAAELRARLYAHPRPRRALADGRVAPQTYDLDEPLPLP